MGMKNVLNKPRLNLADSNKVFNFALAIAVKARLTSKYWYHGRVVR